MTATGATIMHADLDAFFASVAQRDDPRLRGKPVIVGGGVVLAASYEARAFGVKSAMGGATARRLCPQAIIVDADWNAYLEASKQVVGIFRETSPAVERISIDEAFLDLRGLEHISGTPRQIGDRLRREVRVQVGLPITVGIARTKSLAKVASNEAKPDGLLVVEPERELAFLHPLPVEALWGVGRVTGAKLHAHGLMTVGELAALGEDALMQLLGRASGRHLHALAHCRDPRPVRAGKRRRSIGAQSALGRRSRSPESLDATLIALTDRVTRRMRSAGRTGRTLILRLRFDDFTRATRSATLARSTASTATILAAARELLAAAMPLIEQQGCTLVGITLTNLDGDDRQLHLPFEGPDTAALDAVVDDVRERFGNTAVTRGTLLGKRDLATWLFPDEPDPGAPR